MILTNTQMFDSIPVLQQASGETGLLGYAVAVFLIGALIYKKMNHKFLYYV